MNDSTVEERKLQLVDGDVETEQVSSRPVRRAPIKFVSRYVSWFTATLIVIACIITGYLLLRRDSAGKTAEKIPPDMQQASDEIALTPEQQATISVEVVQRTNVQMDVAAPGKVAFNGSRLTPVFSQFGGRLVRLDAEVGALVRAHGRLGMIDTPDIVGMQSDYLQALTTERSARTTLDFARRTRERTERLVAVEAVPQRDLQQARVDESRATDDLQRAEAAVVGTRGRLQSAGMSEADLKRLSPGSPAVNRLVPLVAPITGTVTERKAGLGQVVQAGAGDPLFMIADLSTVWVTADIYEDQLAHVRAGTMVKIMTPAYPNETFAARLDQIAAALDADRHTVAVRCVVPNPGQRLKPGMFARVVLASGGSQTVITAPSSAVIAEGEQRMVFVEESPGSYVKRAVEIGDEINGRLIIRAGLKEGDRVVAHGSLLMSASQVGN
jgi:cobalt-zinc-cadmium efflux system membrane fusion protein